MTIHPTSGWTLACWPTLAACPFNWMTYTTLIDCLPTNWGILNVVQDMLLLISCPDWISVKWLAESSSFVSWILLAQILRKSRHYAVDQQASSSFLVPIGDARDRIPSPQSSLGLGEKRISKMVPHITFCRGSITTDREIALPRSCFFGDALQISGVHVSLITLPGQCFLHFL